MAKPARTERQIKRAAREKVLRQVRSVRASLDDQTLKRLAEFARSVDGSNELRPEDFVLLALAAEPLTNREASDGVLASMAAIEATLAKNPSDHLLQAFYAPTYHALRIELDRLTNLMLHNSEADYGPVGEITDVTTQLQSLANRIKADTDKLGLASGVLTAITKLVTALAG